MSAFNPAIVNEFDEQYFPPHAHEPPQEAIKAPTFRLVPLKDIRPILDGSWLIKGFMPRVGTGLIYGASQTYKSFIAIDVLMAIAAQRNAWGEAKIKNPGAIVYVCAEGVGGIRNRISAARIKHQIPEDADLPFYLIEGRARLGVDQSDKEELLDSIRRQVPEGVKIAVVIVDTLSQSLGGGEENGSGTQIFLGHMTDISLAFDCVACAVHHVGKGDTETPRGHSSLEGNPDFQWLIKKVEKMHTRLTLKKMKDGKNDRSFDVHLEVVELGKDEDGDKVTSLVIKEITEAAEGVQTKSATISKSEAFFFEIMTRVMADHSSSDRAARAQVKADFDGPSLEGVSEEMVRERYLRELADSKSPDAARKAFDRNRKALIEKFMLRRGEVEGRSYLCDIRRKDG